MKEEELSALLASLRTSMGAIQEVSRKSCGASDLKRAAQSMGVYSAGKIEAAYNDAALAMISDLVYFEPNDRGIRAFDRFLAGPVLTLPGHDQDVARRIGESFFSVFRLGEKHETMGKWVEDILDNNRRIWLIDLNVDEPNPSHSVCAVRIFDAGPFYMTLCVITSISDRMAEVFRRAHDTSRRPYRRSLPATVYGLAQLNGVRPVHASGRKFVADLGPELQPGGG
jgi:hypothetical protein